MIYLDNVEIGDLTVLSRQRMLDIGSYHERTSETVSRELCVPMDVPKGEHQISTSLYMCIMNVCVCAYYIHIYSSWLTLHWRGLQRMLLSIYSGKC